MNTVSWIIQVLISAFFIIPGFEKISGSKEKHIADGHLKQTGPIKPIRFLGVLELLGCVGIIVPWLMGITPVLTPVKAVCFCLIIAAGMVVHIKKKEYNMLPMLEVFFTLSTVVAYFRFASLARL